MLARQNASLGGLVLLAIANFGDKSFGSTLAKGLSLRDL